MSNTRLISKWNFMFLISGAQIIDLMMLVIDVTKGMQTQSAEVWWRCAYSGTGAQRRHFLGGGGCGSNLPTDISGIAMIFRVTVGKIIARGLPTANLFWTSPCSCTFDASFEALNVDWEKTNGGGGLLPPLLAMALLRNIPYWWNLVVYNKVRKVAHVLSWLKEMYNIFYNICNIGKLFLYVCLEMRYTLNNQSVRVWA